MSVLGFHCAMVWAIIDLFQSLWLSFHRRVELMRKHESHNEDLRGIEVFR